MSCSMSILMVDGASLAVPLIASTIRGTIVLLLAGLVCCVLRRDSAAVRHFIWATAVCVLISMPIMSTLLPAWCVLPSWMMIEQSVTPATTDLMSVPDAEQTAKSPHADSRLRRPNSMPDGTSEVRTARSHSGSKSPSFSDIEIYSLNSTGSQFFRWRQITWSGVILVTWVCGVFFLIARLCAAAILQRRTERHCVFVQNMHLPQAEIIRLSSALTLAASSLNLRRGVRLLIDTRLSVPVVWGLWNPRLQLPSDAVAWCDEKLHSVLMHELAHVRRNDLFVLAITQFACVVYWFNPVVWLTAWRLHIERERACDDRVLASGIRASTYAAHLLDVAARATSPRWVQVCGLAMARGSSLHDRLAAVLCENRNRRVLTRSAFAGSILIAFAVSIPVAVLRGADEIRVAQTPNREENVSKSAESDSPTAAATNLPVSIRRAANGHQTSPPALPVIPRRSKPSPRDATRPLSERLSSVPETRTRELIYLVRNFRVFRDDEWADAIYELVQQGDIALPELISELDRTDRDFTLRAMGFVLRAMNNPRAVPALIRAIPKTLRPPASGYGIRVHRYELFEFMAKHQNHPPRNDDINFDRPVDEILAAIGRLTGHRFPEGADSLLDVESGVPESQDQKCRLYLERQKYWQEWWQLHGSEFLNEEELRQYTDPDNASAEVAESPDHIDRAGLACFGPLFPTGAQVTLGPVHEVELFSGDVADAPSMIDFDEHRLLRPFEVYYSNDAPNRLENSGADLTNHPLINANDLELWFVDNGAWQSIDRDLHRGTPIPWARAVHDTLELVKANQNTLLFLTREGGQGILQIDAFDKRSSSRKLRYRMWNDHDKPLTVGLDDFRHIPTAAWHDPVDVRLVPPAANALCGYSIKRQETVPFPEDIDIIALKGIFIDPKRIPGLMAWKESNDVSFLYVWADHVRLGAVLPGFDEVGKSINMPSIMAFDVTTLVVRPSAFDGLTASYASIIVDEMMKQQMHYPQAFGGADTTELLPQTHLFHLTDGTAGILQVKGTDKDSGSLNFRYRLLSQEPVTQSPR